MPFCLGIPYNHYLLVCSKLPHPKILRWKWPVSGACGSKGTGVRLEIFSLRLRWPKRLVQLRMWTPVGMAKWLVIYTTCCGGADRIWGRIFTWNSPLHMNQLANGAILKARLSASCLLAVEMRCLFVPFLPKPPERQATRAKVGR